MRAAFVDPSVRLAADAVGNTYAMFESADPSLPGVLAGQPQMVHYRLNESSDGGASWKYTQSNPIGGLVIDDGASLLLGSSFGGANLTSSIDAIAADAAGTHIYVVYGKEDASGADRLYLAEFHPDGSGNLVERANPVALSVPGQRSALPSLAVTANGTVVVQYDTFSPDNGQFHVHLATSTDQGLTFTDQVLDDFTAAGIPFPYAGGNRLLGDYQYIIAQGNTVYGTFAARGNVRDASTGIDTTDKIDPFFYSVDLSGGARSAVNAPGATDSSQAVTITYGTGALPSDGGATAAIAASQGQQSNGHSRQSPADQLLMLLGNNQELDATEAALTGVVNEASSLEAALPAPLDALSSMELGAQTLPDTQDPWLRDLLFRSVL